MVPGDSSSDDDLWGYQQHDAKPLSSSSGSDGEEAVPAAKRKGAAVASAEGRTQGRRGGRDLEPITLSDSEDEEASQLDSQEEAERDGVVPTPAPQLPQLSSALLPPPSQVHDRASKVLEANRRAMEELRRAQQEQPVELSDSESSEASPIASSSPAHSEPDAAPAEQGPDRLSLKCKSKHHELIVRIAVGAKLQKLMDAYRNKAVENGWVQPGVLLTFRFDGEKVSGDETTVSLDLEDEDVIDVAF
mmetsp:Transcript_4241/g.12220  ORF Transcript_4241/g.12220 Transcript_4241/m.12220 type:complete len:247 (+) Transcript_4241:238-978(+)